METRFACSCPPGFPSLVLLCIDIRSRFLDHSAFTRPQSAVGAFVPFPSPYLRVCLSMRTHYSVPWVTAITTSVHLETHAAPLGLGRVPICVLARFQGQDVPCSVDRDIWDQLVHCLRACPGPCGMFSGLSGPYPLDAPNTRTYTAVVTTRMSLTLSHVPRAAESSLAGPSPEALRKRISLPLSNVSVGEMLVQIFQ